MDYKDYYKELGVEKSASEADIKKAYRKLVRKYHPDVSKEADADQRTKALNEAYGVLGDAEKRAAYDDLGRQQSAQGGPGGFRAPPDWGADFESSGTDDNDFFADLFAHVGGRRRANSNFQMQGDDSHAAITIALRDSYHGATRTIVMRVPEADAQGRVVTRERTLEVTIPKGVLEGQQLRMKGQGNPGSGGAPAGDLYLEIRFEADPRYRVEGRDVFETVPVAPWEAALGGAIDVPTPSGTVSVTVPPGSQTGRKLRLRGRGIPATQPGDLYLLLEVVLPPAHDDKARALYETMAREMAFNPRQKLGA